MEDLVICLSIGEGEVLQTAAVHQTSFSYPIASYFEQYNQCAKLCVLKTNSSKRPKGTVHSLFVLVLSPCLSIPDSPSTYEYQVFVIPTLNGGKNLTNLHPSMPVFISAIFFALLGIKDVYWLLAHGLQGGM